MALGLTAWLLQDVKFQLELGARWLQDKNTAKARLDTPSAAVDPKWIGIYHDNGSCLDIVRPLALDSARVLVLGVRDRPLTITDGRHHAAASLTPTCRRDLRTRHPARDLVAGTLLAVRQYTIRCTAYGPPRDQLQLILDSVDWLGESHSHLSTGPVQPLHSCKDLAPALRQLHDARVLDDDRCLRAHPKQEEHLDEASHTMAGADDPLGHDASMSTQMPFDTQIQHPIRSRRNDDDLQVVAVNRLEPVLAGNTQRAELKPRSGGPARVEPANIITQQARLLALIAPRQAPAVPQPQLRPDPSRLEDDAYTTSPRPKETPRKPANRERTDEPAPHASQTPVRSDNGRKRRRDVEEASPSTHHSAKKTSFSDTEPKHNIARELDRFAAECSWMKGLKFNRESFTVPQDQVNILHKPESWYKPAPGTRHPEANLPTKIFVPLSRFEDERVAAEAATLEASSGSCSQTDPSASALSSEDEQEVESDDEPSPTAASWSPSLPPEPPQRPTPPRQDLPPDSSDEAPADATESVAWQPSAAPAATRHRSPPPTLPPSSTENERGVQPSSPPAHQTADDSDDEMEMETCVPQALGEDLPIPRPVPNRNAQAEPQSKSVVQVKETPYVKGKNGQPVVTISPPTQASDELQHDSSSASIVRGTYHDFSSSLVEETHLDTLRKNGNDQGNTGDILSAKPDQSHYLPPEHDAQDVTMFDAFVHDEPQPDLNRQVDKQSQTHSKHTRIREDAPAQPEPTPMSAQLPPKDLSSGEQAAPGPEDAPVVPVVPTRESSRQSSATASLPKRKLETTPTKERKRRHTRLKVVGFGSDDTETLRQQHAEAMRRSKSSTSVESRHESVVNLPVPQGEEKAMAADIKGMMETEVADPSAVAKREMSPRHQSLYAAPSPILRASVNLPATVPAIESMDITPMVPDAPEVATRQRPPEHPQLPPVAVLQPEPKAEHDRVPVRLPEPQPQPGVTRPGPEIRASAEIPPPTAPTTAARPSTVFESFKAAYPEYKGSLKHFRNQCSQIEELDREDRMVPKWMWDDYIIRNSIEYRDYAVECADSGEAAMPYIRFYKDTIRDTVYKKGIVETRATLLQALQELDVKPLAAETAPQPTVQQAARRSSHQSPRPPVQPATYARHPHQQSAHPTWHPNQQSPRPAQQPTQSPLQSPAYSATPPHKKPSRKSLPFLLPDIPPATPAPSTPRTRHSLPAHHPSSHPTPASSSVPARAPPRRKSRLAAVLQHHLASDAPAVARQDEFRSFAKAHAALTCATGSTRVDAEKLWPANLEGRRLALRGVNAARGEVDVLAWGDEL